MKSHKLLFFCELIRGKAKPRLKHDPRCEENVIVQLMLKDLFSIIPTQFAPYGSRLAKGVLVCSGMLAS